MKFAVAGRDSRVAAAQRDLDCGGEVRRDGRSGHGLSAGHRNVIAEADPAIATEAIRAEGLVAS